MIQFCLPEFPFTVLFSVNDATASPPSNAFYKAVLDYANVHVIGKGNTGRNFNIENIDKMMNSLYDLQK